MIILKKYLLRQSQPIRSQNYVEKSVDQSNVATCLFLNYEWNLVSSLVCDGVYE